MERFRFVFVDEKNAATTVQYFTSLNRCSNNPSFYFHFHVDFFVMMLCHCIQVDQFTMDFKHFTVQKRIRF